MAVKCPNCAVQPPAKLKPLSSRSGDAKIISRTSRRLPANSFYRFTPMRNNSPVENVFYRTVILAVNTKHLISSLI